MMANTWIHLPQSQVWRVMRKTFLTIGCFLLYVFILWGPFVEPEKRLNIAMIDDRGRKRVLELESRAGERMWKKKGWITLQALLRLEGYRWIK